MEQAPSLIREKNSRGRLFYIFSIEKEESRNLNIIDHHTTITLSNEGVASPSLAPEPLTPSKLGQSLVAQVFNLCRDGLEAHPTVIKEGFFHRKAMEFFQQAEMGKATLNFFCFLD